MATLLSPTGDPQTSLPFLFCTFSTYQQGPTPRWGCRWKCPHLSFAGPAASHCGSRSRTSGRTSAHRTETSARWCNRCSSGCLQTNVDFHVCSAIAELFKKGHLTARSEQPSIRIVTWRNVLADSCGVHQHVGVERSIKPLISTAGRGERQMSQVGRLPAIQ